MCVYSSYSAAAVLFQNVRCENHIDEVCKEIERAVNHNIQKTLNSLEKDSQLVSTAIQQRLDKDR